MRFRIGYTYRDPFDATFDGESEWESVDVFDEEEARARFREDFSPTTYDIDYILPVRETIA
jgi:hypothetical protein